MDQSKEFFDSIKTGDLPKVKEFLDGDASLVNQKTESGLSAILVSLYYGHPEIANLLISRGAHLDIFEASAAGKIEQVSSLIRNEPGLVNAFAVDGFQPLGLACFFGHAKVVELLLSNDAEVNSPSKNPQKVMPLHSAVARKDLEITQALLNHGAEVNARQGGGFTPLHGAAQNGDPAIAELLLAHGAEVNARDNQDKTPLAFAQVEGHQNVVDLLLAQNGEI
jgi:ankyrin repeat protein